MNRKIKFRGYNYQYKKWFYGSLFIQNYDNDFMLSSSRTAIIDDRGFSVMVDNDTIGQYTGSKDKNGVEIYEGDKVKAKFYGKEVVGEIGFSDGCFLLWNSCVSDNQLFIFTDIEVIGNIYEGEVEDNANITN